MDRDAILARMEAISNEVRTLTTHDNLTNAQQQRLDQLGTEFNALTRSIDQLDHDELEQRIATSLRDGTARLESGADCTTPGRTRTGIRGRALDQLAAIERSSGLSRATLDVAAGWVEHDDDPSDSMARWVTVAGDPNYREAFGKLLRSPQMGHLEFTEKQREAFARAQQLARAMSLTDSAGGYMVPFSMDPAIIQTNAGTSNTNLRAAFTVKTIATDSWNGVTSAGVTASWDAEAAEVSDDSPTLAPAAISAFMARAFVPFSFEVQGDVAGLEAELRPLLLDAKDRLEATAFITGSGAGEPKGIVTAAAAVGGSVVASTTADTYAVGDIYKLKSALPARHRARAGWLANDTVYDLTRQFASGTGPQSAFWADFGSDTPPRLLGKPAWETSEMDGTLNAAATNYMLMYGDLSQYYVIDRVGAAIELIPHLFGANRRPTGQRGLLLWWRTGGDLVNPDAVRLLNV